MNPLEEILGPISAPNPLEEMLGPVGAGAGRGFVNPPVPQPQPRRRGGTIAELRQPMATPSTPNVDLGAIPAAASGVGYGLTAGLTQFPAAAVLQGTRALTGGAPLSYGEALQEVRAANRATQREYPFAYGAGEVGGSGILTALTGGGSLPVQMGKAALQGGVSGATAAESLADVPGAAAGGAALSAGTTGLLGGLGKLVTKTPQQESQFLKDYYMQRQAETAAKYTEIGKQRWSAAEPVLDKWQNTFGAFADNAEKLKVADAIRNMKFNNPVDKAKLNAAGITTADRKLIEDSFSSLKTALRATQRKNELAALNPMKASDRTAIYEKAAESLKYSPKNIALEELRALKGAIPSMAVGAAGGAGVAALTGGDPIAASLYGLGMGGLYDLRQRGIPRIVQALPAAMAAKYPGYTAGAMPAAAGAGRVIGQETARMLPPGPQAEVDTTELDRILNPQPQQTGLSGLINRIKTEGFQQ